MLTCVHWKEGMDGKAWGDAFRIGVINYQHAPRIVRPLDFSNQFWVEQMTREAAHFRPHARVKLAFKASE